MKKLMTALAIAMVAAATQAASFDWKTGTTGKVYEAGTTTLLGAGTAYIFDAGATTQQSVLTAFLNGEDWTTGKLDSKAVASGAIKATNAEAFSYGTAGTSYDFYLALVNGDSIFISDTVKLTAGEVGYETASFNVKTASQAAATALEKTGAFANPGWYTQSVPEPTSGLLLLLGIAGLALKRKQA